LHITNHTPGQTTSLLTDSTMRPLLIFLLFAATTTGVRGRKCYSCSTNPSYVLPPYDPKCGDDDYEGNVADNQIYTQCRIDIEGPETGGYVNRGHSKDAVAMCDYASGFYNDGLSCYCEEKKCNIGLCQQCLNDTTTTPVPTTTKAPVTIPTTPVPQDLSCYSCSNCGEVDEDTTVIQDSEYSSCTTTFILHLGGTVVIRGASTSSHVDGACIDEDNAITCYCSTALCNKDPYTFLE
ncbi:unnamed protein product, partial [Meganyctiphanes norvegica]